MTHSEFIEKSKILVANYFNGEVLPSEVFIVWSCKALQNSKAILSADVKGAPLFEITMNGYRNEIYMDEYVKVKNTCIPY